MNAHPYNLTVFAEPVHVLPLGYITDTGGTHIQTVGDYIGGNRRGVILDPEQAAFLHSLRPDAIERDVPAPEQQLLVDMANKQLVAILPADATLADLDVVPVMRKDVVVDSDLSEGGYRAHVGDEFALFLNDIERRFASEFDGQRSLAVIADQVRKSVLADMFGSHADILAIEHASLHALDIALKDAAMRLFTRLRDVEITTLEPRN